MPLTFIWAIPTFIKRISVKILSTQTKESIAKERKALSKVPLKFQSICKEIENNSTNKTLQLKTSLRLNLSFFLKKMYTAPKKAVQ